MQLWSFEAGKRGGKMQTKRAGIFVAHCGFSETLYSCGFGGGEKKGRTYFKIPRTFFKFSQTYFFFAPTYPFAHPATKTQKRVKNPRRFTRPRK